mmetsp:Transcript_28005/g.90433  ORF Transcript_28005/g.90433 Transcript_28005/m.90433 type:complete len:369 (-) Transcript_28005:837-1943(-)
MRCFARYTAPNPPSPRGATTLMSSTLVGSPGSRRSLHGRANMASSASTADGADAPVPDSSGFSSRTRPNSSSSLAPCASSLAPFARATCTTACNWCRHWRCWSRSMPTSHDSRAVHFSTLIKLCSSTCRCSNACAAVALLSSNWRTCTMNDTSPTAWVSLRWISSNADFFVEQPCDRNLQNREARGHLVSLGRNLSTSACASCSSASSPLGGRARMARSRTRSSASSSADTRSRRSGTSRSITSQYRSYRSLILRHTAITGSSACTAMAGGNTTPAAAMPVIIMDMAFFIPSPALAPAPATVVFHSASCSSPTSERHRASTLASAAARVAASAATPAPSRTRTTTSSSSGTHSVIHSSFSRALRSSSS